MTISRATLLVITALYPVVVYSSVMLKRPAVGFALVFGLVLLHLLVRTFKKNRRRPWVMTICIPAALAAVAISWDSTHALFLPPVLIGLFVFMIFGRSLLPGREPLVTLIARFERGELSPEFRSYTRRVTWVWTVFLLTMALESALLAVYASVEVWSLFTNILNYLFLAALFVGEYTYRIIRFGRRSHSSLWQLVSQIARRGVSTLV